MSVFLLAGHLLVLQGGLPSTLHVLPPPPPLRVPLKTAFLPFSTLNAWPSEVTDYESGL